MWSKIYEYLTDGVVQSSSPPAVFTLQENLNLRHGLSGQSDFGIIEDVCGVTGLRRNGNSYVKINSSSLLFK